MWPLTSQRERRTCGPENFQSQAKKDFLKTVRQKRAVGHSLEAAGSSVVINHSLAIERRGGRGGGGTAMLVRPVGRNQRPWNKGLLVKPLEPKRGWCIRGRLETAG